jgi:cyclase
MEETFFRRGPGSAGPLAAALATVALLTAISADAAGSAKAPVAPAAPPPSTTSPEHRSDSASPDGAASPREPKKIAEGVWAMMTKGGANAGWFTLGDAVVAVDAGRTAEDAEAIVEAIGRTTGNKRISHLVLTNDFAPHAGGAAVFAGRGAAIVTHENLLPGMQALMGTVSGKGGASPAPIVGLATRILLAAPGRHVVIRHFGPADSAGDLVVYLVEDKVLFSGDLAEAYLLPPLFSKTIDPEGWLSALTVLGNLNSRVVVPGYGPIGPPQAVGATREYLERALNVARTLVKGNVPEDFYPTRMAEPDLKIPGLPEALQKSHEANVKALVAWAKKKEAPGAPPVR